MSKRDVSMLCLHLHEHVMLNPVGEAVINLFLMFLFVNLFDLLSCNFLTANS